VRLQGGFDLSGGSGMFAEEIWGVSVWYVL